MKEKSDKFKSGLDPAYRGKLRWSLQFQLCVFFKLGHLATLPLGIYLKI